MSSVKTPKYCRHSPTGQAYVRLNGRMAYLGPYGTAASKRAYKRTVAEFLANDGVPTAGGPVRAIADELTVSELIASYWRHAQKEYGTRPSARSFFPLVKQACRPLRELYGPTPAATFGPLALRTVRRVFIDAGYSHVYCTKLNAVIVRMFCWGVSMEMVAETTHRALMTVGAFRRGETKQTKPIKPAPMEYVDAVKRAVNDQIRAMIELQMLTGMRPGEAVIMRPGDIDMTGKLWTYRPARHKTEHHGVDRVVVLGCKAQAIIRPFLAGRATDAYLFSPTEADAERRAKLTAKRKTPLSCGNRTGTNRKQKPAKKPGERYTPMSYAHAVRSACESLKIPRWTPNQLRHTAATEIRKQFGVEAASIMLGHRNVRVTEIYAERDMEVARRIAGKVG